MTAYLLLSNMASRLQNTVWTVKSIQTLNSKYSFINNLRDFTKDFLIKVEQNIFSTKTYMYLHCFTYLTIQVVWKGVFLK